jgi:circadian clock protein KaiC
MKKKNKENLQGIKKASTGIQGLDEITYGGLPQGRPTLVCGSAGCGKTLFAMEFIVRGALEFNEPGVYISFEEAPAELIANVKSLGFDLQSLMDQKLIDVDYIHVDKSEIEITGEFDLEGLFIRLGYIIDSIGAKRVALDTIESLFSGISNHAILRAELRRLFRWLKDKGVTAIITGERGDKNLTRQGLEEYVSDCVILLDHRINEQYGTRRLRIVKYRGSFHGTNEYPFLINETGISVLPITSLKLDHQVSKERISTGIETLDEMLGGKGYFKGSTILVSGTAGSGKTSMLASFVQSLCAKGEKCLYVALEESKHQIMRNMNAIGVSLQKYEDKGLLKYHITRPTYHSLEMHLAVLHQIVNDYKPSAVVVDPISNFTTVADANDSHNLLTRLIDFLKEKRITMLFSNLTTGGEDMEATDIRISSIVDTWILLRSIESNGERNRTIFVLKSRGMKHSNQVREFLITEKGIKLVDVFVSKDGVLVGSARLAKERFNKQLEKKREEDERILERNLERLKEATDAKIKALQSEYELQSYQIKKNYEKIITEDELRENSFSSEASIRQEKIKEKKSRGNGK